MQVSSVNIGRSQALPNVKASGVTGIYKQPVAGAVAVGVYGLEHDFIADVENHGGEDQAVYVFGTPEYAWWSQELGRELAPGTFGENLTISDLVSAEFLIGDRLRIGSVLLEVTCPRIPCVTLATRMGDPTFVKRFRAAERPGLYCRVLETGTLQVGDSVAYTRYAGVPLEVLEVFRWFYQRDLSAATLKRHLAAPIAIRDRQFLEAELAKLGIA